jgi:hypothetical protein
MPPVAVHQARIAEFNDEIVDRADSFSSVALRHRDANAML